MGTETMICSVCRKRARDCQCRDAPLVEGTPEEPRLYDVSAACVEMAPGGGSDGAYSLIGQRMTAAEIARKLLEILSSDWGLSNAEGACRLDIHIGPAGSYDDLPL